MVQLDASVLDKLKNVLVCEIKYWHDLLRMMLLVVDSALDWFGVSLCSSYAFGLAYSYNDIF